MANTVEALKVTADGEAEFIELVRNDNGYLLQSMYEAIGCSTVQFLGANHSIDVLVDEDGKLKGADPNIHATMLAIQLGFTFFPGDHITGTALFVSHDGEGETISLNEEQKKLVRAVLTQATA